jgi:hypothetical protein
MKKKPAMFKSLGSITHNRNLAHGEGGREREREEKMKR